MKTEELMLDGQAEAFSEAFPFGNGSFGGMDYGGFPKERISLNRDTLWSGTGERQQAEEKAIPMQELQHVRRLIAEEQYWEAQEYIREHMLGDYTESYLPLGGLEICFESAAEGWKTERYLDLERALVTDRHSLNGIEVRVEVFASYPDDCIVVRIRSSEKFSCAVSLWSKLSGTAGAAGERLLFAGSAPSHVEPVYVKSGKPIVYAEDKEGMAFAMTVSTCLKSGSVGMEGGKLVIRQSEEAVLKLCSADGYCGYGKPIETDQDAVLLKAMNKLETVEALAWGELFRRHQQDYGTLYGRMSLSLGEAGREEARYLQYARYLMLSSSRPGGQPSNLQGLWSEELRPAWCCNYTININTEMNYWMTHHANLMECFQPFAQMVQEMSLAGRETARNQFSAEGWAACHNVDLWRHTSPVGGHPRFAYWPMGGVWMSCQLYDHYAFTRDRGFGKTVVYPVMKEAVRFLKSWLVAGKDHKLHTCPSTSPENTFLDEKGRECAVAYSSAMDISLCRELLIRFRKLCEGLWEEEGSVTNPSGEGYGLFQEAGGILRRLPENRIGRDGCLQEWQEDYREKDIGHRHFSPLFGLCPGTTVSPRQTPELAEAGRRLLEKRISGRQNHIGWSSAWLVNLFAKLKDGEKAYFFLRQLLQESTYPNLFALHPPLDEGGEGEQEVFQIDGNFGAAEGILSLLVQEEKGVIEILPALPAAWPDGCLKGVCLTAGTEADFLWKEGALQWLKMIPGQTGLIMIGYPQMMAVSRKGGAVAARFGGGIISFEAEQGEEYTVQKL